MKKHKRVEVTVMKIVGIITIVTMGLIGWDIESNANEISNSEPMSIESVLEDHDIFCQLPTAIITREKLIKIVLNNSDEYKFFNTKVITTQNTESKGYSTSIT